MIPHSSRTISVVCGPQIGVTSAITAMRPPSGQSTNPWITRLTGPPGPSSAWSWPPHASTVARTAATIRTAVASCHMPSQCASYPPTASPAYTTYSDRAPPSAAVTPPLTATTRAGPSANRAVSQRAEQVAR